jgi:prolyl-tRNA synthetase
MRGVPLRMEVGPKDVQQGTVALARRDIPGREGKQFISREGIIATVTRVLHEVQHNMLDQATAFRDANLHEVNDYEAFKAVVTDGWALIWHCGGAECEDKIQEDTKATSRCFPLDQEPGEGKCIVCGKPVKEKAYFARAY